MILWDLCEFSDKAQSLILVVFKGGFDLLGKVEQYKIEFYGIE